MHALPAKGFGARSMIRKSMPSGHDPRVETGFPKRSCSNKKIERPAVTTKAQTRSRGRTAPAQRKDRADSHQVGRSNEAGHKDDRHHAGGAERDAAR